MMRGFGIFISFARYGTGMPIGNLTSQMFANIYLHELDLFCKHKLKIHYYQRTADDIIILWPDKQELHGIKDEIERFLNEELHLELNNKTAIILFAFLKDVRPSLYFLATHFRHRLVLLRVLFRILMRRKSILN